MAQTGIGWNFAEGDWVRLRQIIQQIASFKFGYAASPTFDNLTLTGSLNISGTLNVTGTLNLPFYYKGVLVTNTSGDVSSVDSDSPPSNYYLQADQSGNITWQQVNYADLGGSIGLIGFVPYTGATQDVFLDIYSLYTNDTLGANTLFATGRGVIWSNGTLGTLPATGAGTRFMWIPSLHAFRAGAVTGTQWDLAEIGDFSFAFGNDAEAWATSSTAIGSGATAKSQFGIALGYLASAGPSETVTSPIAIGYNLISDANYAIALGVFYTNSLASTFTVGYGQIDFLVQSGYVKATGLLGVKDTTTNYTYFQGGVQSGDITYILPTASTTGLLKNTTGTLSWDITPYVPTARTITATAPLTIDNTTSADLSANRTLAITDPDSTHKGMFR